ncbi:DUF742 domain-containing protein [Nocardia africana]
MTPAHESWFDDDAGPLIRPYAIADGRSGGWRHQLDMITMLVTVRYDDGIARMEPERSRIVHMCRRPLSVAEVAAHLHLPMIVTKFLICDLIDEGYLSHRSAPAAQANLPHDMNLLQAVLNGIRKL